jgi:hypothetical protein
LSLLKNGACRTRAIPESHCSRSDSIIPRHHLARLEKVERGHHAHPRKEDSLARDDHSPVTGDAQDRSFQRQDQRTTVIMTEGCMSLRSRRKCVDLASKNRKVDERLAIHPADDRNQNSSPPSDILKRVFLPEQKQRKK